MLPLNVEVAASAAELRAQHGLKGPDPLHLAAALIGKCNVPWTNDRRLSSAAGTFARAVVP